MRRTVTLGLLILLSGCTGFGEFLNHAFSPPGRNPNLPMTDSENVRRSLGQSVDESPLTPEPGNVWPGPQAPEPTLTDVQRQPPGADQTTVPGAEPGLPAGRQPRPARRGSSTPPGSVEPGLPPEPQARVLRQPPPSVPGPGPQGQVVQTPQGPAVDAGGTNSYRQLNAPNATGSIMVPNGNGTSTIINPNGSIQTIPTPR